MTHLVDMLSVKDVPWIKLAEKLGMMTLTQLYVDTEAPCQHLLQHYKVTMATRPCPSDHMMCICLMVTVFCLSSWEEVRCRF